AKILPSFWMGDPPSTGIHSSEPVCWDVRIGDTHIGWAVSQCVPGAAESTEIHSRIVVERLPLDRIIPFDRLAPRWTVALLNRTSSLRLDMRSRTTLDALDQLAMFETRVQVNDLPTPFFVNGTVRGGNLVMRSQFGEQEHRFDYPWNRKAVLGSELLP